MSHVRSPLILLTFYIWNIAKIMTDFYLIIHAKNVETYNTVTVASHDTGVFVCLVHHFNPLIYSGINQIWMFIGQGYTKQ